MLKELKIIRAELRKIRKLEDAFPEVPNNPELNLNELNRISEEQKFDVKIEGNSQKFNIINKPDTLKLIVWMLIVLFSACYGLFDNEMLSVMLIMAFALLVVMLFYFRFGSSTYNILIDREQKFMMIKSNNPMGKYIKPEVEVDFRDFEKFTLHNYYSKLKGSERSYCKVILHTNQKKIALFYLPDRENDFTFQKLFISHLINLILDKNQY